MWLNNIHKQEKWSLNVDNEKRQALSGSLECSNGWETFV
jgi:hypothetical protein